MIGWGVEDDECMEQAALVSNQATSGYFGHVRKVIGHVEIKAKKSI